MAQKKEELNQKILCHLKQTNSIQQCICPTRMIKRAFYKYKLIENYNFHQYLWDLMKSGIVSEINEDEVIFKQEIDLLGDALSNLSFKSTTVNCEICLEKFFNAVDYATHLNSLSHRLRQNYLKKQSLFTRTKDLIFVDVATKQKIDCIKSEVNKNINVKVALSNVSKQIYNFASIIKLNRNVHMYMTVKQFKSQLLPGESIEIRLKGYFNYSTNFCFPIALIALTSDNQQIFILSKIDVSVSSEWSSLDNGKKFRSKKKNNYTPRNETIIPGEILERNSVEYKEVIPLLRYDIPKNICNILLQHSQKYPDFTSKYQSIQEYSFVKSARELNIPTKLTLKNYSNMLSFLLNIEEFQMNVDIHDYDTESCLTRLKNNLFELEVPGLAESRPSLLKYDSVYVKQNIDSKEKYQGIVQTTLESAVHLGFHKKFSDIFVNKKKFAIEFGFNRRPIKVEKQAVKLIAKHEVAEYFFPTNIPNVNLSNVRYNYYNRNLNEEQKQAISNLMVAKNAPYLIFGPPGTGKTVTVVEAILQIWKTNPQSKILVCAPSNASVNEIAVRLVDKIPVPEIYRLFSPRSSRDVLLPSLKNISNIDEDVFFMPSITTLLKYRVVLTTLVTAARLYNGGIPNGHFSYVFIDESGYATESETLVPIAGILSSEQYKEQITGQLILAGDPRQLGPILHSNFAKFCGFDISMLERLIDTCSIYARNETEKYPYDQRYVTKLLNNYRSHPAILEVSNKLFYHKELIAKGNEYINIFTKWEHLPTKNFPVIFHNIHGDDKRENNSPSFFNIQEIEEVVNYLSKLIDSKVNGMKITEDHIGIITPYRKQVDKIRKACQKRKWNKILVGTVEQFQGCEKLIIIISTVRSKNANNFDTIDEKHQLGFVRNRKRFNVAITRAKGLMVVIGNANVLNSDIYWQTFIKYCKENNSCLGEEFKIDAEVGIVNNDFLEAQDVFIPMDLDTGNEGVDFSRTNE